MMRRDECFQKIAELRDDAIVVSSYSSAFEWRGISPNSLNYVSVGAMGQAPSHGLGLAIGLPDEKIIVLDGDGALLMNLQCLVTIAEAAPKTFSTSSVRTAATKPMAAIRSRDRARWISPAWRARPAIPMCSSSTA